MLDSAIARKKLEDAILMALGVLLDNSIAELRAQGHEASGRTIASMGIRVETSGAYSLEGVMFGNKALDYLDTGTRPHFPPVDAIKDWLIDTGASQEDAEQAKWPISIAISIHGTPTPGSYSYSKNGRRTEWSQYALKASRTEMMKILSRGDWIRELYREPIKRHNKAA